MPAEFDNYAQDYADLLRDPIRDRFSATSDFFHRRKAILLTRYLRRHNFPMSTSSWVDVGCGQGELLGLVRKSFGHAVGCDPSREMHQVSSEEIYHQESTTTLPFAGESYDFVTAVCVYHHVEEQDRMSLTREIYRVLRPEGIMCMIEHNPFNPVTQLIVKRTPVDANARLLTAARAKRYMRKSGFRIAGSEYFLYLPEKIYDTIGFLEKFLTHVPLGGQYAVFGKKPASADDKHRRDR